MMILNENRSWAVVLICMMMVVGSLSVTPFASSDNDNHVCLSKAENMPHIFNIDFWDEAPGVIPGVSLLNTQVDADHTYTFFIEANYTVGGIETWGDAEVGLCAWYDEGEVGSASAPEGSWATAENRTRQFRITYNVAAATPVINYPSGLPNEFSIHSCWEDPALYGPDSSHHRLYLNVTFEKQTWAADGNTFLTGAAFDINRINFALNDLNSWDFNYSVYDVVLPSSRNESYEEFGIKPQVAILANANPSGSVPPGCADVMLAPQSTITYSANANYSVNVSISNLLRDGVGPAMISATDIAIRNNHVNASYVYSDIDNTLPFGRNFLGAGDEWCVWGNTPLSTAMPTPLNGTVAAGVWCTDYSAPVPGIDDVTLVSWWATIPAGTPEGVYWATITYTIESWDGSFAIDQSTRIIVIVTFPHIYYIDIWDQSAGIPGPSLLNTEVDADNTYTFFVESNYTVGGVENWYNAEVELSAWFDGGNIGSGSMPPDPTWSMPWARTQQFRLYYNVAAGTAWMDYPTGAPFEFSIHSWWEDPTIYFFDHHRLYINVTFSNQAWAADGDGFVNGPAWGGMISDMNMALNDANSWDFNLAIYDACLPSARNDSYEEFGVGSSFEVALNIGWNLVSFPLIQSDTSISSVLSSISGQWDIAQYYDAADTGDHWKSYATFKPGSLNDLSDLNHTMAFWLHTINACTLTVYGPNPTSTSIPLYAGWNMVGYPTLNNSTTISDALLGTGADKYSVYDAGEPYRIKEVGPTYIMKPGEGYWVHVPADTTWTVVFEE